MYENIIRGNYFFTQNKDPRHISPPLNIPIIKIYTHECNPEKDINTSTCKIQTQGDNAHIHDETCKHLITIPYDRLTWLWTQYNWMWYQPHDLIPPTQTFEIQITWLYKRYKHRNPKNDPLKNSHHAFTQSITGLHHNILQYFPILLLLTGYMLHPTNKIVLTIS